MNQYANQVIICGTRISNVSNAGAIDAIDGYIVGSTFEYVVTPNVDHIVRVQKDDEFKEVYGNASLVLPDEKPLLWVANFLGTPLEEKISGSDLFPQLCKLASKKGYRLFFLGGKEGAAMKTAEIIKDTYPAVNISGVYCPPLGFENDYDECQRIIEMIKAAKPDILFVGVGSPKQEKWIYKYKNEYKVPVSIGIGATFDFVSGMVKRAPKWMQKTGLEWFWRLMMEPKRLWRRYLVEDPVFFWFVLKQKLGLLK